VQGDAGRCDARQHSRQAGLEVRIRKNAHAANLEQQCRVADIGDTHTGKVRGARSVMLEVPRVSLPHYAPQIAHSFAHRAFAGPGVLDPFGVFGGPVDEVLLGAPCGPAAFARSRVSNHCCGRAIRFCTP
jgi:hypothetical protein